jgi:hypothetical protein
LGESSYNLFWNNCEHFANEITHGSKKSEQVVNYLIGTSLIAISALTLVPAISALKPLVQWWWNPDAKKKEEPKK